MAFIQNNQNDEDEENQGQPGQSSENSGIISAGSTAAPKAGSNKPQSFATLQSYLKPNQVQGQQLAGQIASNTAKVGQDAQKTVENTASQIGEQVKSNTVNPDANLVNEAKANPTAFVKDQGKLDAFTKQRTGVYGGPASFEATQEGMAAKNTVDAANQKAKLLDSEAGQKQLLSDVQQNKATGITALNQALLSTNPNAAAELQSAKGAFSNLENLLTGKGAEINAQIEAAKKATADANKGASEILPGMEEEFKGKLAKNTADATAAREAYNADVAKTKAWLNQIMPVAGNFNPRLNDPLQTLAQVQPDANIPTAANIASADDYAYEQALERLTGEEMGILQNDLSSQAGSYKTPQMPTPIPMDEAKIKALTSKPIPIGGGKTMQLTPEQAKQKIIVDTLLTQAVDEIWNAYTKSPNRGSIGSIETKVTPNGEFMPGNGERPWTTVSKFYAIMNKLNWQPFDGGQYGPNNALLDRMKPLLASLAQIAPYSITTRSTNMFGRPGTAYEWPVAPGASMYDPNTKQYQY